MKPPRPLRPGIIVWAVYPGGRGDGKVRPMIVATGRRDLLRNRRFTAVVCSTDFDHPVRGDEVLLPFKLDGRCETELRQPTVAVCNWRANLSVAEVADVGGFVKGEILREVFAKAGIILPPER